MHELLGREVELRVSNSPGIEVATSYSSNTSTQCFVAVLFMYYRTYGRQLYLRQWILKNWRGEYTAVFLQSRCVCIYRHTFGIVSITSMDHAETLFIDSRTPLFSSFHVGGDTASTANAGQSW